MSDIHAAAAETAALEPRWVNSFHAYLAAHSLGKPEWIIMKRVSGPCFCSAACFVCRPPLCCALMRPLRPVAICQLLAWNMSDEIFSNRYCRWPTLVIYDEMFCIVTFIPLFIELWRTNIIKLWSSASGLFDKFVSNLMKWIIFLRVFLYVYFFSVFDKILCMFVENILQSTAPDDLMTCWGQGGTRLRIDTLLDVLRPIQAYQF
jgi:hypothetical protein